MNNIGLIGTGVMGKALAKNMARNSYKTAVYNKTYSSAKELADETTNILSYESLKDFVNSLEKPRKIILMVPAGKVVDLIIEDLLNYLEAGDILMDGGNSYFKDSIKRSDYLKEKSIFFYGIGISGGEQGALYGPSIMPSGDEVTYKEIQNILESIAAKKNGEPCTTYIGEKGSGHYVKMVHNGIEYADMQLIAETYLFLKEVLKLSNNQMSEVFENWNKTELSSYLVEITAKILKTKDNLSKNDLIDMIKDQASQKGTGKWTILEAVDQAKDVSLIAASVNARVTSNSTELREKLNKNVILSKVDLDLEIQIETAKKAYYLAKIIAYSQGFSQLEDASRKFDFNLNLREIAKIFRAGCIIQAELLELIMQVFDNNQNLNHLLLSKQVIEIINDNIKNLREFTISSIANELPIPVYTSSITYLDQLKTNLIGANMIQAQRDFFGAHTYERIDQEGAFHYEFENN